MVRFYWHVDDGCSAHVPVNGVTLAGSEPTHLAVEMDVPGVAGSAVGMLTLPPCTTEGKSPALRKIGIVIAHDADAASWQGALLTSMAQGVAKKGFIVMRNCCNLKELRRLRMFEKALDTVSKSPYATSSGVDSWLLVGVGNGARVAATVSSKAKTNIAGLAVVSYPLHESTPPVGKGAGFPDSTSQLMKCSAPLLVLQGELDGRCSAASMRSFLRQCRPQQPGPRFGILPAVNEALLGTDDAIINARTLVCNALLEFAEGLPAVTGTDVDLPGIPSAHGDACTMPAPPPPPPQYFGALGATLDLPVRQEATAVEASGQPPGVQESFRVQISPQQLLSTHPSLAVGGAAYAQPALPAQHAMGTGMEGQHMLAMQQAHMMGLQQAAMGGVDGGGGAPPFAAPLALAGGQLTTLPATLVAPDENGLGGAKLSMPLFQHDEGPMQSPNFQ